MRCLALQVPLVVPLMRAILFIAGVAVGVLATVTAFWFSSSTTPTEIKPEASPRTTRAATRITTDQLRSIEHSLQQVDVVTGEARQAEFAKLRTEIVVLRQELEAESQRRIEAEGTPLPFPNGKPEAIEQKIASAVEGVLGQIGGEVNGVDCAEYPCIVYVATDRDIMNVDDGRDSDRLLQEIGKLGYGNGRVLRFDRPLRDNGRERVGFAVVAMEPGGEIGREDMRKRVDSRISAYFESLSR